MALVLLAVLFLIGAVGMELRRGLTFSAVAGLLLFAWVLPMMLTESGPSGVFYRASQAIFVFLAFMGLTILAFLLGSWARRIVKAVKRQ